MTTSQRVLKGYTWGYYGWGSAATHFVSVVDSLEEQRGLLPVVFVDLRIRRGVRATDFKDKAFERIVGITRYRWMPRLGNLKIITKTGAKIQIADPKAVEDLLDLMVDLDRQNRRVMMFCSCLTACFDGGDGEPSCHRVVVADLLLKEARKRRLALEIAEWPGEQPSSLTLGITDEAMRSLRKAPRVAGDRRVRRYLKVCQAGSEPPAMAGLGWGSCVELVAPSGRQTMVTGPAYLQKGCWKLEVLGGPVGGHGAADECARRSEEFLKSGYGVRHTPR